MMQKLETRLLCSMDKFFPTNHLDANAYSNGEALIGEQFHFQLAFTLTILPANTARRRNQN